VGLTVAPFRPRFPWLTGDLQTIRNNFTRPHHDLARFRAERLELPMGDGDRLVAAVSHPPAAQSRGTVVIIHGLGGCEDSYYVRASAAFFAAHGYTALRLNLRGAGPAAALCADHYHTGRTADLHEAFSLLPAHLTGAGLFVIGFSLSGNSVAKYLGERGRDAIMRAAVSVSAPIDLVACAERLHARRNWPYHRYLLEKCRRAVLAPGQRIAPSERRAALESRTLREFDDRFTAPRHGFAGVDDFYTRCSGRQFLPHVRIPLLLIHAADDPWIPIDAYAGFDWRSNPHLTALLPARGGHVGFHAAGDAVAWHNRAALAFFADQSASASAASSAK
jgi:uncharacterized protein